VLVLDGISNHALGVARGLGRAGCRVIVAGPEPRSQVLTAHSRHVRAYRRTPDPARSVGDFREALRRIVREDAIDVVLPCYDATTLAVHGAGLEVAIAPAPGDAYETLVDKVALAGACAAAGVAYPTTWTADRIDDVPHGAELVVKPRRTAVLAADRIVTRTGAIVVPDATSLEPALEVIRAAELEPIIQPRVERRRKINVSVLRRGGATAFRIAYRVLREYPVSGGMAAATETIDPNRGAAARALDAAERVLDAAGYSGLANVEFYLGDGDEAWLIEVNARVWGSIWLPEVLGLEPVIRTVRDALGEPPQPPLAYPGGRRFHRLNLEAHWLRETDGDRLDLLRTTRPWDVFDILSLTDPMPALQYVAYGLVRRTGAGGRA
jgi:biotin carboxylase